MCKNISVNPMNGEKYFLPNKNDDSISINKFLEINKGKTFVVVQGLGFVGSVMSLVIAKNTKYAVIGIDLPTEESFWKIESINNDIFPVQADDPKIDDYFHNARRNKNLYATYDNYAYSVADIIIVDINLDVDKTNDTNGALLEFDVNLNGFKSAINTIGEKCRENILILVESTVPPGSCKEIVQPSIINSLKKRNLPIDKIKIGHSYERVMPGPGYIDSIENFYRVYSGIDEKSADAVEVFLKTIIRTDEYPLTRLANTTATEMAKVLENSYRALNISFLVEWSRFAEEAGINLFEVVNAIRLRPTHANLMYPGIGVGGYCLTKDALLASWSRQNLIGKNMPLKQSEMAININDKMPRYAFEFLQKRIFNLSELKILLLGISYRGDVGDTRYSPVEKLFDYLIEEKCQVVPHDPYIKYWEEKEIKIDQNLTNHYNAIFNILIIASAHSIYKTDQTVDAIFNMESLIIYDTIGLLTEKQLNMLRRKHQILVLGRGDI